MGARANKSSGRSGGMPRGSLTTMIVACLVLAWEPLWLKDPARALNETAFYTIMVINFWTYSQGSMNLLDRTVENWMNSLSKSIPSMNLAGTTANSASDFAHREMFAENFTSAEFWRASKGKTRPVVVRGLFRESAATQNWSSSYFASNAAVANLTLPVFSAKEGCLERLQDAVQARNFHQNNVRDRSVCLEMRQFADYLNDPQQMYAKQFTELFNVDPTLVHQLELERLGEVYPSHTTAAGISKKNHMVPTLFVGKGSDHPYRTPYHAAAPSNYFLQVSGGKQWRVMPPDVTPYMQPFFYNDVPSIASRVACVTEGTDERYNYEGLPGSTVWLNAGDFLYVPPWWWHEITHKGEDWHIAVGLRSVDSVLMQHIPILSRSWPNTMGILPNTLRLAWNLYIAKLDFGKQYFWEEEEQAN